jgi:hypothetical protein
VNPLLGIGEGGRRIIVKGASDPAKMQKVLEAVRKSDIELKNFCSFKSEEGKKEDFVLQLNTNDVTALVKQLKEMGFTVEERKQLLYHASA